MSALSLSRLESHCEGDVVDGQVKLTFCRGQRTVVPSDESDGPTRIGPYPHPTLASTHLDAGGLSVRKLEESLDTNPGHTQLLRDDHGGLLPDDKRSRVGICSDVGGRDGQGGNFESLDAIRIEARIDDTATLARFHRTSVELSPVQQQSERKTTKKELDEGECVDR